MKHTLLLTALMAGGLCSQSAFADEWVKPVPEATQFQYEDTLYMYNKGAKGFFSDEGGAYDTQAMVTDKGIKMYIQKYIAPTLTPPDSVWDGKTLVIWDYATKHKKWCNLFINDMDQLYVDRGSQVNWFFQLEDRGDNTYRLYGADVNPTMNHETWPDTYLGVDLTDPAKANVLKPMLDIVSGENRENYAVDWYFVSPEEYEKVQKGITTYNLAMDLKAKIEEATEKGVSVPDAEKVYANTASTDEELTAAIKSVDVAIRVSIENSVDPESPMDMASSGFLKNPTFDTDNSGWITTTGAQNTGLATNQSDGTNIIGNAWENWDPDPITGKMYQIIPDAPHGVYRFKVGAFSNSAGGTYVYCAGDSTEILGTLPTTLEVFTTFEGDTLEFGLKKWINIGNWMQMDNAVLTYYGNSDASYMYWINSTIDAAPNFADSYKQNAAWDEYQEVIDQIKALQTKEEIIASMGTFKEALVKMQANVDAYAAYAVQVEDAKAAVDETGNEQLSDYVMEHAEPNLENGELSTEEMIAETENLKKMIEDARTNNITEGEECTFLLKNNDFKSRLDGWSRDESLGSPVVGGPDNNPSVECWQNNFDLYQTISNIPNGIYRVEAPAFYRTEGNAGAYTNRETAEVLTYLYINEQYSPVANIMNEAISQKDVYSNAYTTPDNTYTPNDMVSASTAFANGLYKNTAYGAVVDGTMRVGIRNTTGSMGDRWSIWGAFKLYYEGYNADIIKGILQPLVDEARDTVSNCLFSHVEKDALSERYSAASNAISTNADGETLFNLYVGFRELIDSAKVAVGSYKTMYDYAQQLSTVIDETQETASDDAINNASIVYDEVLTGYEEEAFTTQEADSMVTVIKAAITKLRIPDVVASDDAPADYTSVIVNPNFDNDDNEGWSGSSAAHQKYANAEFYNTNFDMYQVIYGLPNGTYKVNVSGFYRAGDATPAYEKYTEDVAKDTINAFVYAESAGVVSSVPFTTIFAGCNEASLNSGSGEVKLTDGMYIPNSMETAALYFENGYYLTNSVTCKVTDGTLKIGVKKQSKFTNDWTIFDTWTLTYYGDASAQTPDGDASGIEAPEAAEVVSTTYYTIGGVTSSVPVKGINIVKSVMSDGSVKVSKILVK